MKAIESIYLNDANIAVTLAVDFDDVDEVFEFNFAEEVYLTPSDLNQLSALINKMKRVWRTRSV